MNFLRYPLLYCVAGLGVAIVFPAVRHEFWWGIITLGMFISIYGWMAKNDENADRREVGDNCYFIGFVYTLGIIALSVAAGGFSGADGAGGAGRLLNTIGIALATSVIGMLWRFGLTHNLKTPETQFDVQVRRATEEANKLAGVVGELGNATRALKEMVNDFGDTTRKMAAAAGTAEQSFHNIENAVSRYSDKMNEETEKIGEHLTEVAGRMLDDFGKRIANTLQDTQFSTVRKNLQESLDAHRKAVSDAGDLLQTAAESLDGAANSAVATAGKVDGAMANLHKSVANMSDKTTQAIDGYFNDTALAIQESLQKLNNAAGGDAWKTVAEAADNFAAAAKKIDDGLRGISEQQRNLVESTDGDVERLREMRAEFDSLVADLQNDIKLAAKIKDEYRREFENAANVAREETRRLYAKLIGIAEISIAAMERPGELSRELREIARQLEAIASHAPARNK